MFFLLLAAGDCCRGLKSTHYIYDPFRISFGPYKQDSERRWITSTVLIRKIIHMGTVIIQVRPNNASNGFFYHGEHKTLKADVLMLNKINRKTGWPTVKAPFASAEAETEYDKYEEMLISLVGPIDGLLKYQVAVQQ